MEFRVLGPLEVRDDDGSELPLGQGRERALLALLLLHAGEVVSLERIVAGLWADAPPATAEKIVRNYVSHLRRLVDGRLVTKGRGYRLRVSPESLDLARFESLVAQGHRELEAGRSDAADATLDAALALWRGPPLDEFAAEEFALGEITRLEELRLAALEDRNDAQLALGRHAESLPELERLVEQYPYRERLQRQLMLALYRSGRQAEALEQYRRARAALVEGLGLEPGEELRQLEGAILRHDPALAVPARPGLVRAGGRPRRLSRPRALALLGAVVLAAAVTAGSVRLLRSGGSGPAVLEGNSVAVVDPAGGRVLGRLPVGNRPTAVAIGAGYAWVANAGDGTVTKIDVRTRRVVATIGIGVPASDVAVGAGWVWVTSGSEGTLIRIDPRTDTVVQTVDLAGSNPIAPEGAYCVAVGAGSVWVGSASRSVYRIDPKTGAVRAKIRVGYNPAVIGVARGDVWTADIGERTVRIDADTNAVTGSVVGPRSPVSLAAGAGAVWVGDAYGSVWRIDPGTVTVSKIVGVPGRPLGLAVAGRNVWVAVDANATLTRIDARTGTIAGSVKLGSTPLDVALGAGALWVTLGERP